MKITASPVAQAQVNAVRGFNRFYTQRIGVLAPYLGSDLTLTDVRVLYELAHRKHLTASELVRDLVLDAGYLSRILRRFEDNGWLARTASPADARQSLLELTEAGHQAFAPLQQKSRDEAAALLAPLRPADRGHVSEAMHAKQRLLLYIIFIKLKCSGRRRKRKRKYHSQQRLCLDGSKQCFVDNRQQYNRNRQRDD